MDNRIAVEGLSGEPAWVLKAKEVGRNRLTLAGFVMFPNFLAEMASHITAGKKRQADWLIKKVPALRLMNAVFHGGMEAIAETKNPIMKAQRFARAYVGSAPSVIGSVAAIAALSALG